MCGIGNRILKPAGVCGVGHEAKVSVKEHGLGVSGPGPNSKKCSEDG